MFGLILILATLAMSCRDEGPAPPKNIAYVPDGRTVEYGDPDPIFLDMNGDAIVDFTVFVELTAIGTGDQLYTGINPIGPHRIKSGPPDDERFLNMGLLVAETPDDVINESAGPGERWSGDHGTLVIRHTLATGAVWHEGDWASDTAEIVGIQLLIGGEVHYGWLRLRFDKATEQIILVDHAYVPDAGVPILAGEQ
jgi:hypothetical protein